MKRIAVISAFVSLLTIDIGLLHSSKITKSIAGKADKFTLKDYRGKTWRLADFKPRQCANVRAFVVECWMTHAQRRIYADTHINTNLPEQAR